MSAGTWLRTSHAHRAEQETKNERHGSPSALKNRARRDSDDGDQDDEDQEFVTGQCNQPCKQAPAHEQPCQRFWRLEKNEVDEGQDGRNREVLGLGAACDGRRRKEDGRNTSRPQRTITVESCTSPRHEPDEQRAHRTQRCIEHNDRPVRSAEQKEEGKEGGVTG